MSKVQSMYKRILTMFINLSKKKIIGKDHIKNEAVLDFAYEIYKNIALHFKI